MKKGLRRRGYTTGPDRRGDRTTDLMKKGLRRADGRDLFGGEGQNDRPDEEGIKTGVPGKPPRRRGTERQT